jgi:hypothetical protein
MNSAQTEPRRGKQMQTPGGNRTGIQEEQEEQTKHRENPAASYLKPNSICPWANERINLPAADPAKLGWAGEQGQGNQRRSTETVGWEAGAESSSRE